MSVEERNDIQAGLNLGLSRRGLARRLHRPPSTVSREIRRCSGPSYDAARAGQQAQGRRRRGPRQLAPGSVLEQAVQAALQRGWSPEQIAGRLKQMHPAEPSERVSHETLYAYIYAQPRGELRKLLIGAPCAKPTRSACPAAAAKTGVDACATWSPSMTDRSRSRAARWPATGRAT